MVVQLFMIMQPFFWWWTRWVVGKGGVVSQLQGPKMTVLVVRGRRGVQRANND